ncbi:MAG: hypothetical protein CMH54_05035 [Myxococcales bacterium]|nr:hypothetical protein [Myxococcales bacterium]
MRLGILFLFCFLASTAFADVPARLEYQGYLTDVVGTPIDCQGCATPYSFQFALYDSMTDGTLLWSETHPAVDVVNGMFRLELGVFEPLSAEALSGERWLEIQVNEQTPMAPRQSLVSVPFALRAAIADQAIESENAVSFAGLGVENFVQFTDTDAFLTESELETTLSDLGFLPGDSDSLAGLTTCTTGQLLKWNGSAWACADDVDTQLSAEEVDAFVADNGFASEESLSPLQEDITNLENGIASLQTSIGLAQNTLANLQNNLNTLQNDLTNETNARVTGDTAVQTNLDAEAALRGAADDTLQINLNTETANRAAADTTLQTNLDTESANRTVGDDQAQANLDVEIANRVAGDNGLQTNINLEITNRAAGDTDLQANIDAETAARQNDVLTLEASIDAAGIPTGMIAMWSGLATDIPDGWALCDGTNGTPDLLGRFIQSVPAVANPPGATGGANVLDISHTHTFSGGTSSVGPSGCGACNNPSPNFVGGHSHSFSGTTTPGGGSIDNRPLFYTLAFIMKL